MHLNRLRHPFNLRPMLITSRHGSLAFRKTRDAKNAALPGYHRFRETPRFLSGSPGSFEWVTGLPVLIQLFFSGVPWPGPCRIQSRTGRVLVDYASGIRYLDKAVDDLAAAWREEVRPFPAQRVNEYQSSAVFRIIGSVRENRRIGVGVEYLDKQPIIEMPH